MSHVDDFAISVLDKLGIPKDQVTGIAILVKAGEPPRVTITQEIFPDTNGDVAEVFNDYTLVKKDAKN